MKRFLWWMGLVIGVLILWWALVESAEGATSSVTDAGPGLTSLAGDGSGITNAQGIIGAQDQSANFNALDKFYLACQNNNRAIRYVSVYDITGLYGTSLVNMFGSTHGVTGGMDSGGGNVGAVELDNSGGVTTATDTAIWLNALYTLHNTDTMTWRRRENGTDQTLTGTNFLATLFQVRWVQEGSGGTFKIQTNYQGGGWVDCRTIAAAGATNGGWTNITLPYGLYSARILGTSGNVRVQGGGLWNDSVGSFTFAGLSTIGGNSITNISSVATNISWPWMAALNPDLVMVQDTEGAGQLISSYWPNWEKMMTNVLPNASQIWCGQYIEGTANDPNYTTKTNAIFYKVAFNDGSYDFGTNMTQMIADGFCNADRIHLLDPVGVDYMNRKMYRKIIWNAGIFAGGFLDSRYTNSTTLGMINTANTNNFGIGTATPSRRFTILDASDASVMALGNGALWLLPSSLGLAPAPGNQVLTSATLNTTGTEFFFLTSGSSRGSYFSDGGWYLGGNTGTSPGAGNVQAVGDYITLNHVYAGDAVVSTNLTTFLNADQTTTSTTFANATFNHNITVTSGHKYIVTLVLLLGDSTAADGMKVDFAGGAATATSFRVGAQLANDTGGATALAAAASTTLAGVINATAMTTVNQHVLTVRGSFEPSSTSTFIPRIAQNAHSTGTLTVFRGSSLVLTESP